MSAPDTDLKKQKKRHFGPLAGIGAVLLLVLILFLAYLGYTAVTDTPEPAADPAQIVPEEGVPATGAPATPDAQPDSAPSVIEPQETPPED